MTITIADDHVDEDDETITVTLTSPSNATLQTGAGTVTIKDDDTTGVTLSTTSLEINEGGNGTYTVVLDSQPTGQVTITVNDPTDNSDVTADPSSLTFTTGNWDTAQTVNVTVTVAQDTDADDESATYPIRSPGTAQ